MRYLNYEGRVYVESTILESEFHSISTQGLYFIVENYVKSSVFEDDADCLEYKGTLYLYDGFKSNIIEKNVELRIFDDARYLITDKNINEWIISVKQEDNVWHTRDVFITDGFIDDDGHSESSYLAINLSDTPLGNKFENSYNVDIYSTRDYKLYHLEDNKYYLISSRLFLN